MAAGNPLGRIVFQNTEQWHQEISVDLIFTGPQPNTGIEYYEIRQDHQADIGRTFSLSPDSQVDFGTDYYGADRYYETDMLEKEMSIGDDTAEYAVVSMTPLI